MTPSRTSSSRLCAAAIMCAALLLSLFAAAPSAGAADGDGDGIGMVTIKVLDHQGRPMPAQVMSRSTTGVLSLVGPATEDGARAFSSWTGPMEVGSYALVSVSPWGGVVCFRVDPCTFEALNRMEPVRSSSSVLTVTDSDTPVVTTLRTPAPARITGRPAVGRRLTVVVSPSLHAYMAVAAPAQRFGIRWLRDGRPIRRAKGATYKVKRADRGHRLTARLAYPATMSVLFAQGGMPAAPQTLPGKRVRKR
ncbi:hypothetical protein [Nocardioides lijunqiniae]|uniref:hypothetical protein n=1 Tax=Nocardioides lijunqiniae TaxID=2760832 RepID=UPI00187827CE|nr:hypothetical protein [Nocardioides lijunqiniae]